MLFQMKLRINYLVLLISFLLLSVQTISAQKVNTPLNISPYNMELILTDDWGDKEKVKVGGAVYESLNYKVRFIQNEKFSEELFIYVIDVQPDGIINSLEFFMEEGVNMIHKNHDTINSATDLEFAAPYGKETFLIVYSLVELDIFGLTENILVKGSKGSNRIYRSDLQWMMEGELPLSIEGKAWVQRFDFEIRSEYDYLYGYESDHPSKEDGDLGSSSSGGSGYGSGHGSGGEEEEDEYSNSNSDAGDDVDDDWGSDEQDDDDPWDSPEEPEEGDDVEWDNSEGPEEGDDGSWGSPEDPDVEEEPYFSEITATTIQYDLSRREIPDHLVYVDYPLLVMNSPPEPSYETSRGGNSKTVKTPSKAYRVSGNVTTSKNKEMIKVELLLIRNQEIVQSVVISSDNLKPGAGTMRFESEVRLSPGDNQLIVRAVSVDGYAAHERFTLNFKPETISKTEGKDYLILLGVDEYQHWPKLSNAVRDAKSVGQKLSDHYGMDSTSVHFLYNEKCNKSSVDSMFRSVINEAQSNDRVLVYFAGHGYYDSLFDEGYWITQEASKGDLTTYLSNSRIAKYMKTFKTSHTLFIADACFSGTYYASSRGLTTRTDRLHLEKSRWVFCSGGQEEVADNFNQSGHSPFAFYLLQYLDKPPNPVFSISDVSATVIKNVSLNSNQVPVAKPIQNAGDEGGEFVFKYKP
jgi:Caspase domain